MSSELGYVVLAAGKGTRMHSDSPKVLQQVLGKPLLVYVLDALATAAHVWTVVGFGAELVRRVCTDHRTDLVFQAEQLGTGHAVSLAWPEIEKSDLEYICVLNGDTPHVPLREIQELTARCASQKAAMGLLTLNLENPFGYGRVIRAQDGAVQAIVEEKDLDRAVYGEVHEVNSGVYVFDVRQCADLWSRLDRNNAQGEFYLTQMVSLCAQDALRVEAVPFSFSDLLRGINSPKELVAFEESLRAEIVSGLLDSGVMLRNRNSIVIGPDVRVEPGADITGPCEIYGRTNIARGAIVGSHCVIRDADLGPCQVKSFSHIEGALVRSGAVIGPFARLRPGTVVGEEARVGNFVEVKKSILHQGAKAGHLTYLGDSDIGPGVNVGAGTITCNYDGANKHKTTIRENAFIGSNTALVAPVTVGAGALVAAGSVVTKDVPDGALCVGRSRQANLERKKR